MFPDRLEQADVLWLDAQLVALNKPRGIPTRGRPGLGGPCLYELARTFLGQERLWLVHLNTDNAWEDLISI